MRSLLIYAFDNSLLCTSFAPDIDLKIDPMYSHIIVRLKSRHNAKPADHARVRAELDQVAETELKSCVAEVLTFDVPTAFAWKLRSSLEDPRDIPQEVRNVLEENKNVELYSAAVATPEEETTVTLDTLEKTFVRMRDSMNHDEYDVYALKLRPSRNCDVNVRELSTTVRDRVEALMEAVGRYAERSFAAKKRAEQAMQEAREKLGPKATEDEVKAAAAPRVVTIALDLFKGRGFWSRIQNEGGNTLAKAAPRHGVRTTGALSVTVDAKGNETILSLPYFGEIGDRVVVLKIGEIFLKRGNRGKFMNQLQGNIQFKLHGLARVVRVNHLFVVMPMSNRRNDRKRKESIGRTGSSSAPVLADEFALKSSQMADASPSNDDTPETNDAAMTDSTAPDEPASPFTDEELAKITDICRGIPGVESVLPALRTLPDKSSILRGLQYMLTLAGTSNPNIPAIASVFPDGKIPDVIPAFGSLKSIPLRNRVGAYAASTYLSEHSEEPAPPAPGSPLAMKIAQQPELANSLKKPADEEPPFDLTAPFVKGLVDVSHLGFKLDVHLHQPCPFKSRSLLARELQVAHRNQITNLVKKGGCKSLAEFATAPSLQSESKAETADDSDDEFAAIRTNQQGSFLNPKSHVHVRIEVLADLALLSFIDGDDVAPGVGGQPTGTASDNCHTVVALLSGGMDSPVAAYRMMVRGMRVVLVHFQNANVADEDTVREKIVRLAEHLSRYQIVTYLYIVPFAAIQDAIITQVPGPARMLVYRRFMMQVAARIGMKYGARFLTVGDSIGQVASQTAPNLYASYTNTPLPVLSPLIGCNKKEIMEEAKRIGTYEISALPYGDCCSYFLAKHPVTNIKLEQLREYEAAVGRNIDGGALRLIRDAFNASAVLKWHKPSEGTVTLRDMRPVFSQYRDIVAEMLQQCPTRAKDIDDGDEEEVAKALAQIAEIEERVKKNAAALGEKRKLEEAASTKPQTAEEAKSGAPAEKSVPSTTTQSKPRKKGNRQEREETFDDDDDFDAAESALLREHKFIESTRSTLIPLDKPEATTSGPDAGSVDSSASTKKLRLDAAAATAVSAMNSKLLTSNVPVVIPEVQTTPQPQQAVAEDSMTVSESAPAETKDVEAPAAEVSQVAYFDNAATTPLLPQVFEAMLPYLGGSHFGNSSSVHAIGNASAAAVEEARRIILGAINGIPQGELATRAAANGVVRKEFPLVFTSGGTESNNMAVMGTVRAAIEDAVTKIDESCANSSGYIRPSVLRIHLITSAIEHSATLEPFEQVKQTAFYAAVNANLKVKIELSHLRNNSTGVVDTKHLDYLLHNDSQYRSVVNDSQASGNSDPKVMHVLTYVSVMHANNEIGVVQPLTQIGETCEAYSKSKEAPIQVVFHSDACQTFGKLFIDVVESKIDLLTLNGHKIHGPKGIGALYIRPGVRIVPSVWGGHHEGNFRSGTLNVPGIVGMGAAAAYFYGIQTPLLGGATGVASLIAPPPANTPMTPPTRAIAPRPTSYLIPNETNRQIVQRTHDLLVALTQSFPKIMQNGPQASQTDTFEQLLAKPCVRLPNILSVVLDKSSRMDSSAMIKFLSARGVYVSSGSACANNAEPKPSHVLTAINVKSEFALSTIRVSVGALTSQAEVDRAALAFAELAEHLSRMR